MGMDNALRQTILAGENGDSVVIHRKPTYGTVGREKFLEQMVQLRRQGKIRSTFEEDYWRCWSDLRTIEIRFSCDEIRYATHVGRLLEIPWDRMKDILKCYVISCCGTYVFDHISRRIQVIEEFLTHYLDDDYRIEDVERVFVLQFLEFLGLSEREREQVRESLPVYRKRVAHQRKLDGLVNYLSIDSELTDLYTRDCPREVFLHWFPVYFWDKVSMLLPMRPTEILVTPFDCVERRDGEVWLSIRRTQLKKGLRQVDYDVDRDYRIYSYRMPDGPVMRNIERYQQITAEHTRRFLMDFSEKTTNGMLARQEFNHLLEEFIRTYLIGSHKYDYSRFAAGIEEFSIVTAGDSRPIAMANLYYQNCGADICRQLAGHEKIRTSAHYYTNVSETVNASAIVQMQRRINAGYVNLKDLDRVYGRDADAVSGGVLCLAPERPMATGDISPCLREEHLAECFGCRYYQPDEKTLREETERRKRELDEAAGRAAQAMARLSGKKPEDLDKAFLDAQTAIHRYRTACGLQAQEEVRRWVRSRHTPMPS